MYIAQSFSTVAVTFGPRLQPLDWLLERKIQGNVAYGTNFNFALITDILPNVL